MNLAVEAEGLPEENGGRGVTVGNGGDIHGLTLVSGSKSFVFRSLHNWPKSPWERVRPDPCKIGLRVSRRQMSKV
jgi:hypothetical protein